MKIRICSVLLVFLISLSLFSCDGNIQENYKNLQGQNNAFKTDDLDQNLQSQNGGESSPDKTTGNTAEGSGPVSENCSNTTESPKTSSGNFDGSVTTSKTDPDIQPPDYINEMTNLSMHPVHVTSQQVADLQKNMTYRQIFSKLVNPCYNGISGHGEYIIDGNKILMLKFEKLDEVCTLSGKELLKDCIIIQNDINNPQQQTAFAVVIYSEFGIRITSPTYKYFTCASVSINDETEIVNNDGTKASKSDIKYGSKLKIVHAEQMLDSWPVQIFATKITVL